jgi:hypothetical protein
MLGNASFHEYISVANNVLTLTAKPTSGQPPSHVPSVSARGRVF